MTVALEQHELGRTGLTVTNLCIGTSALGSMPSVYGYDVPAARALATLHRAFESPITFLDTSNDYGGGASERLIGDVLKELGGLPDGALISTKVDPDSTGDFSGARVRRSVEESCERLGLGYLPLVFLHDPDRTDFEGSLAPAGAVPMLLKLKEEGVIGHVGVAGGPIELMRAYVATGSFEVLLTHNRYTLLDKSAGPLIEDCVNGGVAVVNAAPFGGGLLARGPSEDRKYAYRAAPTATMERALMIDAACRRHGVRLGAAALQFSMRDQRISSTVVGVTRPERVDEAISLAQEEVPEQLWDEIEQLTPPQEVWLH